VPSPPTLRRLRMRLDVAYMLLTADLNKAHTSRISRQPAGVDVDECMDMDRLCSKPVDQSHVVL
jgi:hypothetical protein